MKWYESFANKHRKFGIENLMLYIVLSQLVIFVTEYVLRIPIIQWLELTRSGVMGGQLWRLITFIFIPSTNSFFWVLFTLLFYHFVGSSLENHWGKATFTLYYLTGIVGTIVAAMISGRSSNLYLNLSLFMAFAYFFPEAEFRIYFLIPIKAKYMGIAYLIFLGFSLITSLFSRNWYTLAALLASLINLILFIGPDAYRSLATSITNRKRRKRYEEQLRQGRDRWNKDE